jgi:hypothetical protein
MEIVKIIAESNPSARLLDGFDEALVGIGRQGLSDPVAVYDRDVIASILVGQGMTQSEAEEFIQHNFEASYMGEGTPIIARFAVRTGRDPRSSVAKACSAQRL